MLLIAFGDVHMDTVSASRIPEIGTADAVILTGDLTIDGGRREARQVLSAVSKVNPRIYAQIGNMDRPEVDTLLTEEGMNLNGQGVLMGDVGLLGLGGSTETPFGTPSEFSEDELNQRLLAGYDEIQHARHRILVSHCPPLHTRLDQVRAGLHAGSRAVREFLEQGCAHLCVCGHIHEAVGTEQVGPALVLNPGMVSRGGYVRIVCSEEGLSATLQKM